MPYYDSEAIERARQVDLLTYLQTCEPQELVHVSGNVYCTKTHDSLRISNGKWCWFSRGIGGYSALDYLIKVNGYSFMDAMESITGRAAIRPPSFVPAPKEEKPKHLLLPQAAPFSFSGGPAVQPFSGGLPQRGPPPPQSAECRWGYRDTACSL